MDGNTDEHHKPLPDGMLPMRAHRVDNSDDARYRDKVLQIAEALCAWSGPVILCAHQEPDGDAFGSALALKRALAHMGKATILPMQAPGTVRFLAADGELHAPLATLPGGALLVVLDVADLERTADVPIQGDAFPGAACVINIDHHGTNNRFGDLHCIMPSMAATAMLVKDVIDALPVPWTKETATPCLTGIMTDTGIFRYSNTDSRSLRAASDLIACGVDYADLVHKIQSRDKEHFIMLGKVMAGVEFPLNGLVAMLRMTRAMQEGTGPVRDDSSDYLIHLRYAKGTELAVLLRENKGCVKISVRSNGHVSAQAVCMALGGGGHVKAAGATIPGDMDAACRKVLAAAKQELIAKGFSPS